MQVVGNQLSIHIRTKGVDRCICIGNSLPMTCELDELRCMCMSITPAEKQWVAEEHREIAIAKIATVFAAALGLTPYAAIKFAAQWVDQIVINN